MRTSASLAALTIGATTAACAVLTGVDWDRVALREDGGSSETDAPSGTDGASDSDSEGGDGGPACASGQSMTCGRGTGGIACALSMGTSFGAFPQWQTDFSDANGWSVAAANYATIQFPDV